MIEHKHSFKAVTGYYKTLQDLFPKKSLTVQLKRKNKLVVRYYGKEFAEELPISFCLYCPKCFDDTFNKIAGEYSFYCKNKHATHQLNLLVGERYYEKDYERKTKKEKV
jgi:hypothetical protein